MMTEEMRQAMLARIENNFTYHAPKGDQPKRYETIRAAILSAAKIGVECSPCCAEQTRALNALDEAMFLFNAAIARRE